MKKVTYIITHRESTTDRRGNLFLILDWLNHIDEIEKVIIVEQDFEPRISDIVDKNINKNYKLEYYFLHNPARTFNKCWAFNHGAKKATTEWLAFGDNDVLMKADKMNFAINSSIGKYDSFTPYETVYDLSPKETQMLKDRKDYINIYRKTRSIRYGAPYGGGIFFIKKESFFNIGAWDENFLNWGAEDEDISHRIKSNLNFKSMNQESCHLHHTRTIESTHQNRFYKQNLELYNRKKNMSLNEIMSNFDIDNIGREDKYSN